MPLMKHTLKSIRALLKSLASDFKDENDFESAVKDRCDEHLGSGMYRSVSVFGDFVVKVSWGGWGTDGNVTEAKFYNALKLRMPALAQFLVKPTLWRLPNKHNIIVMPRVNSMSPDCEEYDFNVIVDEDFTPIMREQLKFIQATFFDSHESNVGWDYKLQRVWMIDFNIGCIGDFKAEEVEKASKLLQKVSKIAA
jgi:hypothetical protein